METLPVLAWALLRTETCWSSGFLVAWGKEIIKNIKWTKQSLKKRANLFNWKPILVFKGLQAVISWQAPAGGPLSGPFRSGVLCHCNYLGAPASCLTLRSGRAVHYMRPTVWYDQIHLSLCSFLAELWQSFVTDVTSRNHWKVTLGRLWVQMRFIRLMPFLCLATSSSSFLVLMPSSEFPSRAHPPPGRAGGKASLCRSNQRQEQRRSLWACRVLAVKRLVSGQGFSLVLSPAPRQDLEKKKIKQKK